MGAQGHAVMNGLTLDELFPGTTDRLMGNSCGLSQEQIKWLVRPPRDELGAVLPIPETRVGTSCKLKVRSSRSSGVTSNRER